MEQKLIELLNKMEAALPSVIGAAGKGAEVAWSATLEVYRVGAIQDSLAFIVALGVFVLLIMRLPKLLAAAQSSDEFAPCFAIGASVTASIFSLFVCLDNYDLYAIVGMFKPELLVAKDVLDAVMGAK